MLAKSLKVSDVTQLYILYVNSVSFQYLIFHGAQMWVDFLQQEILVLKNKEFNTWIFARFSCCILYITSS